MKNIIALFLMVVFSAVTTPAFAKGPEKKSHGGAPHPNAKAYEHANEHARFKIDDVEKNLDEIKAEKEKKKAEKLERKAKREAERQKRRAEKEAAKLKRDGK